MASSTVRFDSLTTIQRPPSAVFERLADLPAYRSWMHRTGLFRRCGLTSDDVPVLEGTAYFDATRMGRFQGEVTEFEPPDRFLSGRQTHRRCQLRRDAVDDGGHGSARYQLVVGGRRDRGGTHLFAWLLIEMGDRSESQVRHAELFTDDVRFDVIAHGERHRGCAERRAFAPCPSPKASASVTPGHPGRRANRDRAASDRRCDRACRHSPEPTSSLTRHRPWSDGPHQ